MKKEIQKIVKDTYKIKSIDNAGILALKEYLPEFYSCIFAMDSETVSKTLNSDFDVIKKNIFIDIARLSFSFGMWRFPTQHNLLEKIGFQKIIQSDDSFLGRTFSKNNILMRRSYMMSSIDKNELKIQNMSEYYGRNLNSFYCEYTFNNKSFFIHEFKKEHANILSEHLFNLLTLRKQMMNDMLNIIGIDKLINDNGEYLKYTNLDTCWHPYSQKTIYNDPIIVKNETGDYPWLNQ